ncbi:MAG: type II secretion system protein GspM [Bryobacteraceae bacterium]
MNEADRNKRALMVLAAAVVMVLVYWLVNRDTKPKRVEDAESSVALAEKRLQRLRAIAAALPERERNWKLISDDVAKREKALIIAADKDLAQEKLLEILRKVAQSQRPPIEVRGQELGQARRNGDYGEVLVTLTLACRIEQLVNFLADLPAQAEGIASEEMRVSSTNPDTKVMQVRLTIAGLVPAKLVPAKKEMNEF